MPQVLVGNLRNAYGFAASAGAMVICATGGGNQGIWRYAGAAPKLVVETDCGDVALSPNGKDIAYIEGRSEIQFIIGK